MDALASSSARGNKAPNPCNGCKLRHKRCDPQLPSCLNCRRSGIDCIRGYSVRFRHSQNPSLGSSGPAKQDFEFSTDQPWPAIQHPLVFIDETEDASAEDHVMNDREYEPDAHPDPPSHGSVDQQRPSMASFASVGLDAGYEAPPTNMSPRNLTSQNSASECSPGNESLGKSPASLVNTSQDVAMPIWELPWTPTHLPTEISNDPGPSPRNNSPTVSQNRDSPASRQSISLWPQGDYQAASLLRYFVQNLAPMFDLCDSERHFARIVPQRAAICPALYNAVLAASAKTLSRNGEFDSIVASQYHQECLNILIPALSDPSAALDENLLTATVILRYLEEVDIPISGETTESHLLGTRAFLAAQNRAFRLEGLRLAVFWLALRQEVYMGFVHNRPIESDFFLTDLSSVLNKTDDDCSYANRVILHCVHCLRHCYGPGQRSRTEWERLTQYLDEWWQGRPQCFQPLWESGSDKQFFPEAWYLNSTVITGVEHYHLARALLTAHNPKIPRLGIAQKMASNSVDEDIKLALRQVCGVAKSNPPLGPYFVTASVAITMAGDRFQKRHEQEQLCEFLVYTDTQFGWPTLSARRQLMEAWGWDISESPASFKS